MTTPTPQEDWINRFKQAFYKFRAENDRQVLEDFVATEIALAEARGEKRAIRAQNESLIALLKEHGREDLIEATARELETVRHNKPSN